MTGRMKPALYSPTAFQADDAQPVELLGGHPSGRLICREVDRLWPGIFLATLPQVGLICDGRIGPKARAA